MIPLAFVFGWIPVLFQILYGMLAIIYVTFENKTKGGKNQ
jgi:hypothetical protein